MGLWPAYILVLICILIVGIEYIYLYAFSSRTEAGIKARNESAERIREMLHTIVNAPTDDSMRQALAVLKRYVGMDRVRMDILSGLLLEHLTAENAGDGDAGSGALVEVCDMVNPSAFYSALLKTGDIYDKAYACRRLSGFARRRELSVIREFTRSKNRDLAYNAAMALSELGDEGGLMDAILYNQNRHGYSHRVLIELIQKYTGDREMLINKLLACECGDNTKTAVLKAAANYGYHSLARHCIGMLSCANKDLRAAALSVLGRLGDPIYQNEIIAACSDPHWIIRLTAVKALKHIRTPKSMQALSDAVQDPEWWVRNTAAKILVGMDTDLVYVQRLLQKENRNAADSILFALYQICDMGS